MVIWNRVGVLVVKKRISKYLFILLMLVSLSFQTACTFYSYDTSNTSIKVDTSDSSSNNEDNNSSSNTGSSTTPPSSGNGNTSTTPDTGGGSTTPPNTGNNQGSTPPIEDNTNKEPVISSPVDFKNGYVTSDKTTVETEHFTFKIDGNDFVPSYLEEYIEVIYDALETASGLSFYNAHYNPGKIIIEVGKVNNERFPESEMAGAYAYSIGAKIHVSCGDLLLGNSYAIVHELSHILQYSQSSWSYSRVFVEGFAEYNSYNTIKYLETHNIDVAKSTIANYSHINNMYITGNIYSQTVEYWIANESEAYDIAGNGPYAVGMRFMDYLKDTYNDYTSWIKYYEKINPYYTNKHVNQEISLENQYKAMKMTYGNNVFNNFYTWLRNHEDRFERQDNKIYDLSKLQYTYIYPEFNATGNYTYLSNYSFSYKDLYIYIDDARNYLKNYKGKDVSALKLEVGASITVECYDSTGRLIAKKKDTSFSLVGVSYIKLVGEGTLINGKTKALRIIY